MEHICKNCGHPHDGSHGDSLRCRPKRGESRYRFCSLKCARGFSSKEKRKEINKKVSDKLKGVTRNTPVVFKCKTCGNEKYVTTKAKRDMVFCCRDCQIKYYRTKEFSEGHSIILKGKTGGYRIPKDGSTWKRGGYYRGVYMDSSWEIKFAKRLDEIGIEWSRPKIKISYIDIDGKNRNYHPDFIVENHIVEIKGYWTDKVLHKMRQVIKKEKVYIIDSLSEIESFESFRTCKFFSFD